MTLEEYIKMPAKGQRRKPRHIESGIQSACVGWFRAAYPEYVIFSVPNGGSRNALEAANLKREGALAGVADLVILANSSVLFVEMKSAKGTQSPKQKVFEARVRALGFEYKICRSLSAFVSEVTQWLLSREGA